MTEQSAKLQTGEDRLIRRLKGLWKLLFGRTTMFVLLLLIQSAVLFGGSVVLGMKILAINHAIGILAVLLLIHILNAQSDTSFKLMWVILIASVPVFGVTLFFYTRLQPGTASRSIRIDQLFSGADLRRNKKSLCHSGHRRIGSLCKHNASKRCSHRRRIAAASKFSSNTIFNSLPAIRTL